MCLLGPKYKLYLFLVLYIVQTHAYAETITKHKAIDDGLDHYTISNTYDSYSFTVHIFKINTKFYDFILLNKSENEKTNLSVDRWVEKYNLTGAINAGMFQADNSKNVGYMKNFSHVNNKRKKSSYKSVLAFNKKDDGAEGPRLFDLSCDSWSDIYNNYNTIIQNYRTVSCKSQNDLWSKNTMRTPMALVASDLENNIYFIFTAYSTTVSMLNKLLLSLDFNIQRIMYLEGGSQASISIDTNNYKFSKSGAIINEYLSPIPNVIGFTRKD